MSDNKRGNIESMISTEKETSDDIKRYLGNYDTDFDLIPIGTALLDNIKVSEKFSELWAKHPESKNACYIGIRQVHGDERTKGTADVIKIKDVVPPKITRDMLTYETRKFQGHTMYIHPDIFKRSIELKEGMHVGVPYNVTIIIIPGKGAITIPSS